MGLVIVMLKDTTYRKELNSKMSYAFVYTSMKKELGKAEANMYLIQITSSQNPKMRQEKKENVLIAGEAVNRSSGYSNR